MILVRLFLTFFLIGAFTIGGGYAMLTLIEHMVVDVHGWITEAAFTDIVAISQMTPGPIGINSATYIGYSVLEGTGAGPVGCFLGSLVATTAVVLPSFLIVLALVKAYDRIKENAVFRDTMQMLRPTVIGLIGAAALVLVLNVSFEGGYRVSVIEESFPDWQSWMILAAAFLAAWKWKAHPILIIVVAGFLGYLIY